jgi:hypothetical protein
MSVETTQRTMEMWFKGDVAALSDDVVFEDMGNHMGRRRNEEGKINRGRVYVLVDTFLEQVGASRSAEPGGVQASPS